MISMRGFEQIEAMQDGMLIPPQLYQPGPDMSAFHDVLAQGASIIVRQIQHDVPQIQWLATSIERQLGLTVGVNAYCSFSRGGAFKPHWDRHDVLVIQVHGKKSWHIWDAQFKSPVERSHHARHDITSAPSEELVLAPGDVLYIPRGEPHAAAVSGGASVHLSLGFDSLNGVDVLQQLNSAASADDFLRGDLPSRETEAQLQHHEKELKTRLHRLVDALDVRAFLEDGDANRAPVRQASLAFSREPGDILRLTLRRRIPLPERAGGPTRAVTIGGASYQLAPASVDILRRLFVSDCQSRRDLIAALAPVHEESAVAAGLSELVRLGFLVAERAV